MNGSSHTWMSHVTGMNEPQFTYTMRRTNEWVMSPGLSHICEGVTAHWRMNRVKRMSKSYHMYESVMSQHTYEWVMSRIRMSPRIWTNPGTHTTESCHTFERVSHSVTLSRVLPNSIVLVGIWMRHVTYMNESCHVHAWAPVHTRLSHVTRMIESRHKVTWSRVLPNSILALLVSSLRYGKHVKRDLQKRRTWKETKYSSFITGNISKQTY